jgi:hypothetical protein
MGLTSGDDVICDMHATDNQFNRWVRAALTLTAPGDSRVPIEKDAFSAFFGAPQIYFYGQVVPVSSA